MAHQMQKHYMSCMCCYRVLLCCACFPVLA